MRSMLGAGHVSIVFSIPFLFSSVTNSVLVALRVEDNLARFAIAPVLAEGVFLRALNDPSYITYRVVNVSHSGQVIQSETPSNDQNTGSFTVQLDEPGTYLLEAQDGTNKTIATSNKILVVASDSDSGSGSDSTIQSITSSTSAVPELSSSTATFTITSPESISSTGMRAYPPNASWSLISDTFIPTSSPSQSTVSDSTPTISSTESSNSAGNSSSSRDQRTRRTIGGTVGGVIALILLVVILTYYIVPYFRRKQNIGGGRIGDDEMRTSRRRRPWFKMVNFGSNAQSSIIPFALAASVSQRSSAKEAMISERMTVRHDEGTASSTTVNVAGRSHGGSGTERTTKSNINQGQDHSTEDTPSSSRELILPTLIVSDASVSMATSSGDALLVPLRRHTPPPSYRSSILPVSSAT
ncbi:hypothetical protein F5876DRAFT_80638 [Lentinula aff. lateritia]|uniref:Uncharacterized protein n=1 Tax=Lentinula aff. lateritia TaxID=2804960 RepID=A0ACC1TPR6_9AGAR|nr:hypothetical protein F5876DRAFT_80638 [Lentinula aff. lateritia]